MNSCFTKTITKPIVLSDKEINRASDGITVVVRQQTNGLYLVVIVRVASGKPVFRPRIVPREEVSKTVKEEVRMAAKMGMGGAMARASRYRNYCS